MKIGIFETEHFEVSYSVIRFFDNDRNEITIFTYGPTWDQFQHLFPEEPKKYAWTVKPQKRSKILFIRDMYREIKRKKISLVYLDTISDNFIIYALFALFLRKVRVVLTIHNINTQFEIKPPLSPRRIIRYIGRRILLSAIKEFNVIGETMVASLKNRLPKNKKVYCVPGSVFEEDRYRQTQPSMDKQVNIVIPGSIDGRRRDYEQALAFIRLLEQQKIPATVTFLGRFYEEYGKNILDQVKKMELTFARIGYYGFETVDQPEFDRVMSEGHLVFIPSVLTTILEDGVVEIYGTTISSGNLFDVVRHAKPFIVPEPLKTDAFLERSCYRYKNLEEVVAFILLMKNEPGRYAALLQDALEASRNYTVQKVRERNSGLFAI